MLYIDHIACTRCGVCVDACPTGAIRPGKNGDVAAIDQALCNECLACLDVCPTSAIRRVESSELVPALAVEGKDAKGEVIEGEVIPALAIRARRPGQLVALASTALTSVASWLLPRAADALVAAVERRLARGTTPVLSAPSTRSGNGLQTRQMGRGAGGRGRQRQHRRRGQ